MLNYAQGLTVVAMGVFLSSVIFPSYLTTPYLYAAVISCGPSGPLIPPCYGTPFDDNMKGDNEHNVIGGMGGNDQISGAGSVDSLHGGYGDDSLSGGPGDDSLFGSVGTDSFKCGTGNDRIVDFNPSEGDTKSNDCENIGYSNHTGVSNETLTGFPANHTLSANNSTSQ